MHMLREHAKHGKAWPQEYPIGQCSALVQQRKIACLQKEESTSKGILAAQRRSNIAVATHAKMRPSGKETKVFSEIRMMIFPPRAAANHPTPISLPCGAMRWKHLPTSASKKSIAFVHVLRTGKGRGPSSQHVPVVTAHNTRQTVSAYLSRCWQKCENFKTTHSLSF